MFVDVKRSSVRRSVSCEACILWRIQDFCEGSAGHGRVGPSQGEGAEAFEDIL